MRDLLERIDAVLARVPADSFTGREVRSEMLDHLADHAAARVAAGASFEAALAGAAADFGGADDLERDYYRDHLASRYALGLFDRELLRRPERALLELGAACTAAGLLLQVMLPAVATHAAAMGVARAQVDGFLRVADAPHALRRALEDAVTHALPAPWGGPVPAALLVVGVLAFSIGGFWTLRRARLLGGGWFGLTSAAFAVLPVLAGAFLLAVRPAIHGDSLVAALLSDAGHARAARELGFGWWLGLGFWAALGTAAIGVLLRARAMGRADTLELRQAAFALLLITIGTAAAAHLPLTSLLEQLAAGDVAPVRILGAVFTDLSGTILGVLLMTAGILRLRGVADRAQRTMVARGVG